MPSDILYFEPRAQRQITRRPTVYFCPWVTASSRGAFRFNQAAIEVLSLRKGSRIAFGQEPGDPREWFVRVVAEGGHVLREFTSGGCVCRPGLGFASLDLLNQVRKSLPRAPAGQTLRLKLEGITVLHADGSEAWPLLTAPYWQTPPTPAPRPSVLRRVSFAAPGLLGIFEPVAGQPQQLPAPTPPSRLPMPAEAEAAPRPGQAHPGQLIEQALTAGAGYTILSLAEQIGRPYQYVYSQLRGRVAFTPAFALELEAAGVGPASYFWQLYAEYALMAARQQIRNRPTGRGRPRRPAQLAAA